MGCVARIRRFLHPPNDFASEQRQGAMTEDFVVEGADIKPLAHDVAVTPGTNHRRLSMAVRG
jgi:hypothetical protein